MNPSREHFVVAIGASAGGLEAIHEFFDHMSDTASLSFVVIQHLSSDFKSLLVELVARHTHMKVFEAKTDLEIEESCIYVIPNNKFITIRKNKLVLEEKNNTPSPNNAIDTFLYSLARDKKNRAIAVILSGTGTDGTKGVEAIKNNQGMVIVQEPSSARFNGMPNSAITLGVADHILAPAEMPAEIITYIREPMLPKPKDFSEEQLEEIFSLIHSAVGFDFHYYKLPTIVRRITRRMMQLGIAEIDDYLQLLRNNNAECKQLGNDFLIGVTRFFRDPEAWQTLSAKIKSDILPLKGEHGTIKAWVCACSTGEEAYTLAIVLNEVVREAAKPIEIKVFATDIDEEGIEIAGKGLFSNQIEKDVPQDLLGRYFNQKGRLYQINPGIRKQIVFARHDVIRDPPFINNDLITCRNMLIYVSPHLQKKIYALLMFSLSRSGLMMLGPSEHSTYIRENVEELNAKWKIFRKTRDNKIASVYLANIPDRVLHAGAAVKKTTKLPAPVKITPIWEAMKQALEEDISVAGFFIDNNFEIRETAGNFESILTMPKKALRLNLLDMVPQELHFILSTEIRKAWKTGENIALTNLKAVRKKNKVTWEVLIKPMEPHSLVVITEQKREGIVKESTDQKKPELAKDEYIAKLRTELDEVRSNLDLAVQDLETTNEELQSSNEELLSANEELQSSNEELQSLNEELHTLNTEHQMKIKELLELNDDLNNFFRSTDIAQVFLDRNLTVRRFNAASSDFINLIESDIGRPLSHISNNIRYENFLPDVQNALRNQTSERELMLANGRNLLMRIMPYLTRDREVAGVIISFVDITTITQLSNTIRAVLNSSPGFILGFRSKMKGNKIEDFILETANTAAGVFLHKPENELIGSSLRKDIPLVSEDGLFEQFVQVVQTDEQLHREIFFKSEQKWYSIIASTKMDGFVVTFSDITAKKTAEQRLKKNYLELVSVKNNLKTVNEQLENKIIERTMALSASEERFRLVARATNDALWEWNLVNNTMWLGETFFKIFGYLGIGEQTNRGFWLSKIHPEDASTVKKSLNEAVNSGKTQWSIEYRFRKESGEYAEILDRGYILHDEFGTPYRMLGSMFDVTELKTVQHKLATMNEQLEHKVAERTQELEKINDALEQSNNDLQQFASVASHDLQEPLRKIQMFAKLIQESYEQDGANPVMQFVEKILHSSRRMRSLITDILDYSRLSDTENDFETTDLNELIKGTLDDFEITIREKNATIQIDELPHIEVISGQIRQVFQNLLSNALKFSKPSTPPVIHIHSKPIAKRSFMSMEQENGDFHLITVSDNGIGFDQQFAGNIFNLFHRLHSKDKFEGTGIGLAVTKRIVEKHHGLIRADSRENEGASFVIILPAKHAE